MAYSGAFQPPICIHLCEGYAQETAGHEKKNLCPLLLGGGGGGVLRDDGAPFLRARGYAIKNGKDRRARGVVPGVETTCKINVLNVCHLVTGFNLTLPTVFLHRGAISLLRRSSPLLAPYNAAVN